MGPAPLAQPLVLFLCILKVVTKIVVRHARESFYICITKIRLNWGEDGLWSCNQSAKNFDLSNISKGLITDQQGTPMIDPTLTLFCCQVFLQTVHIFVWFASRLPVWWSRKHCCYLLIQLTLTTLEGHTELNLTCFISAMRWQLLHVSWDCQFYWQMNRRWNILSRPGRRYTAVIWWDGCRLWCIFGWAERSNTIKWNGIT